MDWAVRDELYAPMIIRRNPDTGVCAVFMAPREDSFGVMNPARARPISPVTSTRSAETSRPGDGFRKARLVVRTLPRRGGLALYDA